ncbi:TetR/AcrR family transcriptional regulator [Actinomadura violacea]|uniref:TetR family transcriptional regulator n=1 Tax=Actinomadura violacea TaxID=2819934 RepID=A0ABS3RIS4_9ACTN|nr:TetR/AcrR family transcriptional regulator [Actinomadura violacea]MBO2456644.1 TetR family transcriptional regulator [Actinomadura violacea]
MARTDPAEGRRERRKAATRRALADAALRLFLEHGYDGVTVTQIADAADVSIATLFKHVPDGKQALIFDDGSERREAVLAAVRDRPPGRSALDALHDRLVGRGPFARELPPDLRRRRDLIMSTPELAGYQRRLWLRAEAPLAEALAADAGRAEPAPADRALARYVLETPELAAGAPDPRAALREIFDRLESGWAAPDRPA